jgi:glycosyltransferase involved in cell wall biosynthesis
MKVLFYNHTGQVSGAERVLQTILSEMDRDTLDAVVVCPHESALLKIVSDAGIRALCVRLLEARFTWRPDRLAGYLVSFARVIREARAAVIAENPDLVHANSIRAGLVMSAATFGLRVPIVWHAHDILPRHPLSTFIRLFTVMSSRNRILAVSHAVARRFRGRVLRPFAKRVQITVVHNSVDLKRFHPDNEIRARMRRDLELTDRQKAVGIVGQLTPRKGQLELIKAFKVASGQVPGAVLLIVGEALFNRDELYAQHLEKVTAGLELDEQVRFLGPRSDVHKLLQAMDVLVVNSHEEPFGLTALEGLASGLTVLATRVGGTAEMITHGEDGWLIPPQDDQTLSRALVNLLQVDELRAHLGQRARATAIARFSTDRFIREIKLLYFDLIKPRPSDRTSKKLNQKLATD